MMTPDPRVKKAFYAMRDLGIAPETIKPVLKNMLRLYGNNLDLIEAENYRALADAIFEHEDDQLVEGNKKVDVGHDVSDSACKRSYPGEHNGQSSSTVNISRTVSTSNFKVPKLVEDKGKRVMRQSEFKLPLKRLHSGEHGDQVPSIVDNSRSIVPIEEGCLEPYPEERRNESSSFIQPEYYNKGILTKSSSSQQYSSNKVDNGLSHNCSTICKSTIVIASTMSGEVKLSVKCNSSLERSNFHIPNLDAVLKYVEDKYLRSYKVVRPEFSLKKLLKDLCVSYMEMGTNSTNRSIERSNDRNIRINGPAKIRDITNGLEKIEISLVDEIGKNELVPKFVYIPQNTVYQNAHLHISLARFDEESCCSSCSGNCLSSSIPCACARETGGEFAYTLHGLLREDFLRACIALNREPREHDFCYCQPIDSCKIEYRAGPCKGHLLKKFIKECWRKCGCHFQCGNRVVQRGITCKLQVFLTHGGKGWGLRSLEDLPKGAFVCEYVGEILTNTELYYRNEQSSSSERHTYPVNLDADWGSERILNDEEALSLDGTFYGNVARFINHRCYDPNLIEIPVQVETPDHHYYHVAFFTTKDVPALEELTWDYGIDFKDVNHPIKAFQCSCGSALCRGRDMKQKMKLLCQ